MPGTLLTTQMYEHTCFARQGFLALDTPSITAPRATGETLLVGRCWYRNSAGEFVQGLAKNAMGYLGIQNSTDKDVQATVGNFQSENSSGYPVCWTFEIETTEFDSTQTFAINNFLTAWDATSGGVVTADIGLVCLGVPYTDTVIGQVSAAVAANENSKSVLRFWTMFLPVAP